MQVKVQKLIRTTWPRRPAAASGGELTHSVAPPSGGMCSRSDTLAPLADRSERRAELGREQPWLLPGGEMVAPVQLVEVDEVGVGPLGPAARDLVDLVREGAHRGRDRDALDVEEADRVLPVQAGGGNPGVRQPVERDVVQDLVPGQVADGMSGEGV